jgi:hypothetical protein
MEEISICGLEDNTEVDFTENCVKVSIGFRKLRIEF